MFQFIKRWREEAEAKRQRSEEFARKVAFEASIAEISKDLGFFQIAAEVPDEIRSQVADLLPVTEETLEQARAFVAKPQIRALRGGIERRREIEDFARSLNGDTWLSFTMRDFAKHFGFNPQREAARFLDAPDLLGRIGYGTMVKGATGAMITGAAMVGTFKQSMHNGYITASVGGMVFSRHASDLSIPERHALASLNALRRAGSIPERDHKGLHFAFIYGDGRCEDDLGGDGLGGRSISEKDLLAQRIGRHLVSGRIASVDQALNHLSRKLALLDDDTRLLIDRHLPLPAPA